MNRYYVTWTGMSKEERNKYNILTQSRTIPIGSTSLKKIWPNYVTKSLVPYGKGLNSNMGYQFNPYIFKYTYITPLITQILVGILLGDGNIRKPTPNGNPQIQYNQGFNSLSHMLNISLLLSSILTHFPSLVKSRDMKLYLHLYSRCLACLIPLYNLFIVNGKKRIPLNINEWLSPISLAFWAMDDGSSTPEGFYLNTHSFSYEEQLILQNALLVKFGILCNINKHGKQYKLYIRAQSMNTFRSLVLPHFSSSFYYKLFPKMIRSKYPKISSIRRM